MRSLILTVLALLILGGGAAGSYFYFQQPAEASIGATAEHTDAKAEPAKASHRKSHSQFVELDPLILPIVDANGVSQIVSLVVVIEVEGSKNADKVRVYQPRLKDAYIQELYGVLNKHAALQGGVLQVGMIKQRLTSISDKVMGEGMIQDVLLQVVQQRPI